MKQFLTRYCRLTADGSHTLYLPHMGEHYHSMHGAISESRHVFLQHGFAHVARENKTTRILEVGFGTGLNALLTLDASILAGVSVHYTAIEPFPLNMEEVKTLNLAEHIAAGRYAREFALMHAAPFEETVSLADRFELIKHETTLQEAALPANCFHLIYHDAFAPQYQPGLWDENVFRKMYAAMMPGGVLTTYCAKGSVKRALKVAGFEVSHPPGPAGKREMTKAVKHSA